MQATYSTDRLILTLSGPHLAEAALEYLLRNREFLKTTEPERHREYFTLKYQRKWLAADIEKARRGTAYKFWLSKQELPGYLIGTVSLSDIVYANFLSCYLQYRLCKDETHHGYMYEAAEKIVDIAFDEVQLHRIEANIMPVNKAALHVAERMGFVNEGVARAYMRINGVWRDHIHMVRLNPNIK